MGITVRNIRWVSTYLRPAAMPSTKCPAVRDLESGDVRTEIMTINHCLACAHAESIALDMLARTGEVYCAAQ